MGEVDGVEVMVNRTGYTGEEGVELLAAWPRTRARSGTRSLERGVVPCGLGARDTLRLEVCYPLHGNDITPETDAISAGLGWVCALDKDFTGADVLRRDQGRRAGAQARRLRDGGSRDPAAGHGDRRAAGRSRAARSRRCSTSGSAWATSPPARARPAPS